MPPCPASQKMRQPGSPKRLLLARVAASPQGRGDLCWDSRGRATPSPPRARLQHPSACSMDFSLGKKQWEGRRMMDLSEGFHEENLQTLGSGSASAIPAVQPSE